MEGFALTRDEAIARSKVLSGVNYKLLIILTEGQKFIGSLTCQFDLSDEFDLWFNFNGHSVNFLEINDSTSEIKFKGHRVSIGSLQPGHYEIKILFESLYSHDGLGLHKLIDPADQEVYLYSQFEPFAANRVFPCFDQPNIKATFELSVIAKPDWKVISNTPSSSPTKIESSSDLKPESSLIPDLSQLVKSSQFPHPALQSLLSSYSHLQSYQIHNFQKTLQMSTYVLAICAGPYSQVQVDYKYPLGFYCRISVQSLMNVELYKTWTIAGFEFYESYFDYPYPFGKYDQVFVPEFNFVAMENIGCVTLDDKFLFPNGYSQNKLVRACIIMLHEMSHMWFGNLVTMKWWDDLWLNESFATFISVLCTSRALGQDFPETWLWFYTKCRNGLLLDQLSTTHPIFCDIRHSIEIFSYFDAITYEKGSNVLKQLFTLIGEDRFKGALQRYFKKFQFSNTRFEDLIEEIKAGVDEIDMNDWAEKWIKTAGVNLISADVSRNSEGFIEKVVFRQDYVLAHLNTCRLHYFKLAVFNRDFEVVNEKVVALDSETKEIVLDGRLGEFLLADIGHDDFAKFVFDDQSLKFFLSDLKNLRDPLARIQVYGRVLDLVSDKKLELVQYFDFIAANLASESELFNIIFLVRSICETFRSLEFNKNKEIIYEYSHKAIESLQAKLKSADERTSRTLYKLIIKILHNPIDVIELVSWLYSKKLSPGIRWSILKKYSTFSLEAKTMVEAEHLNDKSHEGLLSYAYCSAAYLDSQTKAQTWRKIVSAGNQISKFERIEIMKGFNQINQRELLGDYGIKYFLQILRVVETADLEFSSDFCKYLVPLHMDSCDLKNYLRLVKSELPESRSDLRIMFESFISEVSSYIR